MRQRERGGGSTDGSTLFPFYAIVDIQLNKVKHIHMQSYIQTFSDVTGFPLTDLEKSGRKGENLWSEKSGDFFFFGKGLLLILLIIENVSHSIHQYYITTKTTTSQRQGRRVDHD